MKEYYAPDLVQLQEGSGMSETTCRYCGERILFAKGDHLNILVGLNPHEPGTTHVVGLAHVTCFDPADDMREGALHAAGAST